MKKVLVIAISLASILSISSGGLLAQNDFVLQDSISGISSPNGFLSAGPVYPAWIGISANLQVGRGFVRNNVRAVTFGGNFTVSQDRWFHNQYLGEWSMKGRWSSDFGFSSPPGPAYVSPGVNYLADYHRWSNYSGLFGLRERESDIGVYMEGVASVATSNQMLKDLVIAFGAERGTSKNRLIFENHDGVDPSAPGAGSSIDRQELATILHNGNLGLGIDNPQSQLQIKPLYPSLVNNTFSILNTAGSEVFTITNNGKVGLNVPLPAVDLDVVGNSMFTGGTILQQLSGSAGSTSVLQVQNSSASPIFRVLGDGKLYFDSYQSSNDQALFIKPSGELYTSLASVPNPNQIWLPAGNTFTGTVPGYIFGTYSAHDIDLISGGVGFGKIYGNIAGQEGRIQLRKPVAIGGSASNYAMPSADFALTIKTLYNSITGQPSPFNETGVLECLSELNAPIFEVTNNGTYWMGGAFSILGSPSAGTADMFVNGNIASLVDNVWEIGDATNWFKSVYSRSYPTPSDMRLKSDIIPINNGLDLIRRLKPVSYFYSSDFTKNRNYGFIAQDLVKVIPDIVINKDQMMAIEYMELIALLTQALQELDSKVRFLEERLVQYEEK